MKLGKVLLNVGKVALKVGVSIGEMAVEEITGNVKKAYKDNRIDQKQYDNMMTSSKKASNGLDTLSKKLAGEK